MFNYFFGKKTVKEIPIIKEEIPDFKEEIPDFTDMSISDVMKDDNVDLFKIYVNLKFKDDLEILNDESLGLREKWKLSIYKVF